MIPGTIFRSGKKNLPPTFSDLVKTVNPESIPAKVRWRGIHFRFLSVLYFSYNELKLFYKYAIHQLNLKI